MPRYELVEGTSSKFWEISLDGASFTVRYGRIGTDGQSQSKAFATADAARTEHDKLVREKTRKGYAAVDGGAAAGPANGAATNGATAPGTDGAAHNGAATNGAANGAATNGATTNGATTSPTPSPRKATKPSNGATVKDHAPPTPVSAIDAPPPPGGPRPPSPERSASPPATKSAKSPPQSPPVAVAVDDGWIDGGNGYALSVRDDKIVARNAKGKVLASVPKDVKEGEPYQALADALELLETHARECRETVEGWMLRSLPVPAAVIAAVWPDVAWRALLENTVVATPETQGLLRAVGPRGLGVVTLDGDTVWLADATVTVPHPMLLPELDEWRGLLAELGLTQTLPQLFRETFAKPTDGPDELSVEEWSGGEFELLAVAMNEARKGGWRVRGGSAVCAILEGGRIVEARYDLGEGDPMYETTTGSLTWSDPEGATLRRADVGPVAWSEGMRMAAVIYKKRKVDEKEDAEE